MTEYPPLGRARSGSQQVTDGYCYCGTGLRSRRRRREESRVLTDVVQSIPTAQVLCSDSQLRATRLVKSFVPQPSSL